MINISNQGGGFMSFKHILTAYDGSEASAQALNKALQLADNAGTKLTVIHVFNLQAFVIGESVVPLPVSIENQLHEQANKVVDEAKKKIQHLENAEAVLEYGHPATKILEYAQKHQCDVIIIGSRGLGRIREFMLGSVSHNIAIQSEVPVLIVK